MNHNDLPQLAMFTLNWPEILIVVAVILLLFGKRLPKLARHLGQSLVAFTKSAREVVSAKKSVEKKVRDVKKNVTDSAMKAVGLKEPEDKPENNLPGEET